MEPIKQLEQWIKDASSVVFFGGAGVSTESGILDFRSENGLYRQQYEKFPEETLSHDYFFTYPEQFYRFYRSHMLIPDKNPNPAHLALAQWEKKGKCAAVITQNIDGLHQAAGSANVLELHGSIHRNTCLACGKRFNAQQIQAFPQIVPHCSCGGLIKPDVVLYGEALDETTVRQSVSAIVKSDLLIVGGTSLTVYPAAGLIQYQKRGRLVLINRSVTPFDKKADLVISESIGQVFGKIQL